MRRRIEASYSGKVAGHTGQSSKVRDSNLNIRILAHRYDVPNERCTIIFQTPQSGESVSYGTVVGVVIRNRDGDKAKPCSSH